MGTQEIFRKLFLHFLMVHFWGISFFLLLISLFNCIVLHQAFYVSLECIGSFNFWWPSILLGFFDIAHVSLKIKHIFCFHCNKIDKYLRDFIYSLGYSDFLLPYKDLKSISKFYITILFQFLLYIQRVLFIYYKTILSST